MVSPTGKVEPFASPAVGEDVGVKLVTPQLSKAVGSVHATTALQAPVSLFTTMSAGQPVTTGSSVSITVTVNEQVSWFPELSIAV